MKRRTACNRDCPDACSLEAEVVDGRLIALKGAADDPITKGFLCPRTTRFVQRQTAPDRLLTPLYRPHKDSQELLPLSWQDALDLAAEKMRQVKSEHGPEAIFHYLSGGSLGYLKKLTNVIFDQFGPCTQKRGDICSGAGEWAQEQDFGISDSSEMEDLLNAKLILIWGKNVHTSSVHLLPILLQARKNGTRLVCIDPGATRAASISELTLCPRPGTDAQIALAMVTYLAEKGTLDPQADQYCNGLDEFLSMARAVPLEERFQRAGVPLEQGLQLCRLYDEHRPSSLLVGWGAPRRSNGAETVRAMDALSAVSGNIGVPGATTSFYFQRRRSFNEAALPSHGPLPRTLSEACMGLELERANPRVRLAWITAGNPVAMLPDSERVARELRRVDFTVVVDTHFTDTCAVADLVLPTLTLVEDEDVMGAYGNTYLRSSEPVVEPAGDARHELWIHQQMAQRLGFGHLLEGTPAQWKDRLLKPEVDRAVLRGRPVPQPGAPRVLFEGRKFLTPDGKVHLMTNEPPMPPAGPEEFPFRLMAVSHPDSQSSQWSTEPPEVPVARISSQADPALRHGEIYRLESSRGGFPVRVRREDGVHPELVILPKGGSGLYGGWCPNALIEARETNQGEGACYYEEPVRLLPLRETFRSSPQDPIPVAL
jgi:anaerobic selenocysteine-containing dehydrogenase